MTYFAMRGRPQSWGTNCRFLLASIAFHGLVLGLLLLVANTSPFGAGTFGRGDTEVFSVDWYASEGDGSGGKLDTALANADSSGAFTVSEAAAPAPAASAPKLLAVEEIDPNSVFNTDAPESTVAESQNLFTDASSISLATSRREHVSEIEEEIETAAVETSQTKSTEEHGDVDSEGTGSNTDEIAVAPSDSDAADHGGNGKGPSTAAGGRQTQFFGIPSTTRRIVYVIDASESMRQHRAMELARRRLLESLQQLNPDTQFQIIFFNLAIHTFGRPQDKTKLVAATSVNLRAAKQFINGIQPDSGTDRMAAILLALSFRPDTVFVLTDADAPELDAQELREIQRRNRSKATIHVVEFGIQADLSKDSFLKRLARQNGGRHHYHDLTRKN
ncbi:MULTISPECIES: hypothetical protein [unclassified Schlesneria]|uniref:hypothetical protein n=1 Tax=Schlesneria TaxID=656899 RepID=UPI0035A088D9